MRNSDEEVRTRSVIAVLPKRATQMDGCKTRSVYSRKQFLREALRGCFRFWAKYIDLEDSQPEHGEAVGFLDYFTIASDFSPALLRQEALRLGLDPESTGGEKLLRSLYKAMKKQHQKNGNDAGNPS